MSDVSVHSKTCVGRRQQRSIYQVHYSLQRRAVEMAHPVQPLDVAKARPYARQVAGHMTSDNARYLGVLQCNNGTILKPIIKEIQKREVDFYTRLSATSNKDLLELRQFTPKYYGCRLFTYNGHQMEYLVLEDLAERMLEPCIMDVKIGKRTYDPLATAEKIAKESTKYAQCKREFGFCIPGYQVYRLAGGALHKYGKEHGKRLHGPAVTAAIREFLNGSNGSLCRALILQFLSALWRLQRWAARQTTVALYSASLLLVYDANRLRECCGSDTSSKCRRLPSVRRKSITSLHSPVAGTLHSFSGQLTAQGPFYKKVNSVPITPMSLTHTTFHPQPSNSWDDVVERLSHNHSLENNYEDKLFQIKMNYRALLDQLSEETPFPNPWGSVKVIDFAHAFFNEEGESKRDENFREGIDSFVAIFEGFLRETDDQVL